MAPDLNSLPPSPYNPRHSGSISSRRVADSMPPPSIPLSPSLSAREAVPAMPAGDNTGVGVGPGKLPKHFLFARIWMTEALHHRRPNPSSSSPHSCRPSYATGKRARSCSQSSDTRTFFAAPTVCLRRIYNIISFDWLTRCCGSFRQPHDIRSQPSYSVPAPPVFL